MTSSEEPRRRGDSQETARRVLEAAADEFVERGYDKAVISDIARRAGVTSGAIYPRWPHKSDLMVAALDHMFEQLLPERRLKTLGIAELPPPAILSGWGASLLNSDEVQDVLVQVFGSARNNDAVHERLQRFVDDQADQLSHIVERGKDEGFCDPEHDTVAMTLMIQAIGVGTHLLFSAGLAQRHIPSEQNWVALLVKLLGAMQPQTEQHG